MEPCIKYVDKINVPPLLHLDVFFHELKKAEMVNNRVQRSCVRKKAFM